MRRFNSRNIIGLFTFSALVLIALLPACRKEGDILDRNRAPETFLTSAPPETTNTDYRVHIYWYGEDRDGIVTSFMWHQSDTLMTLYPERDPQKELLDWNPEARKVDYEAGRLITASDTVIIFTGFDITTGAMLNRQAFHIVAIDDGGKMDKTPARIQFFAKVNCVPEVNFRFKSDTIEWKKYVPGNLDTISMFEPFIVEFVGSTCNNMITGYQWIYSGDLYPVDTLGVPYWYIPKDNPPYIDVVRDTIENQGDSRIPQGDFYFKVTARDEAGARSRADILTGEGVFQLVVNHDPDTRIRRGISSYTTKAGSQITDTLRFDPAYPDTVPYNSRLRIEYIGWDDTLDILEHYPPLPMRYQFKFERWGYGLSGGISSYKPAWMPEKEAEDTDCTSEQDSTTMRIGSYDYVFLAKSFDEQYRYDHTPASVSFVGNFPPGIDKIAIAYDSIPAPSNLELADIKGDTVFIAIGRPLVPRPEEDYVSAYSNMYDPEKEVFTQFFKLYINGSGHDDYRDPPRSGIMGWYYSIEAEENYYFRGEEEWLYDFDPDTILQEIVFILVIPRDPDFHDYPRPDPEFVNNPPLWMGNQDLTVIGSDLHIAEIFIEGIRGISPEVDEADPCVHTSPGRWVTRERGNANYARIDTYNSWFYLKLVY